MIHEKPHILVQPGIDLFSVADSERKMLPHANMVAQKFSFLAELLNRGNLRIPSQQNLIQWERV